MKQCDCGSGQTYETCCQLYHTDLKLPKTPEALMRSRYSAYAQANIAYIQATMRDKASLGFDPISAKLWAEHVIWINLQILATHQNSVTQGQVEFIATFVENKKLCKMHEISDFSLIEGRWFYIGGQPGSTQGKISETPIARNMRCVCGSQKKWKQCHGK